MNVAPLIKRNYLHFGPLLSGELCTFFTMVGNALASAQGCHTAAPLVGRLQPALTFGTAGCLARCTVHCISLKPQGNLHARFIGKSPVSTGSPRSHHPRRMLWRHVSTLCTHRVPTFSRPGCGSLEHVCTSPLQQCALRDELRQQKRAVPRSYHAGGPAYPQSYEFY